MWNLINTKNRPNKHTNILRYHWLILSILCIQYTTSIDVTTSTKFTATPTVATAQENADQSGAASSNSDNFLSKLISSAVDTVDTPNTEKIGPNKRNARDNRYYYARDYGVREPDQFGTSSSNPQHSPLPVRNLKGTDQPNPTTAITSPQHTVERRCLRCADPYYDDRRAYPTGYDRRYDDRRGYDRYDTRRPDYYDPYYDERSMSARPVGRYDDRYYSRYDERRPYDMDRRPPYDEPRYDYPRSSVGGGYRDPYERDPYYSPDMRYEPRRPATYDYSRYDRYDGYRGGYDSPPPRSSGFRPWDETTRGQSGWDNTGRGYYFASGRPEPSGYWGYDRGYAQGWNYGSSATGSDAGYRDDWRDPGAYRPRDPYYNRGSSGSGYRGTSYLYDRDGRPPQTTTPRSTSHPDDSKDPSKNDTNDMNNNNNPNSGYKNK